MEKKELRKYHDYINRSRGKTLPLQNLIFMKKDFYIIAAILAVSGTTFLGCSSNNDEVMKEIPKSQVINMKVYGNGASSTRGDATNATNALSIISSFQTWAYDASTDDLYMGESVSSGREVSNTGSELAPVWNYTPKQFWPVNPLNFVAITPVSDPSINSVCTNASSGIAMLTANVMLYTGVEEQKDIMMANANSITKTTDGGNVPFSFKHALSQVVFKGRLNANGAITKVTIAEISLCNINRAGTLTFASDGTWYGGASQPASVNSPVNFTLMANDLENHVFDVADVLEPARTYTAEDPEVVGGSKAVGDPRPAVLRGSTTFDLTTSNSRNDKHNAWMMIPQATTAWAGPAAIGASPASGSYLKVRARLEKDGVVVLGNTQNEALYIPLTVNWERSKKYVYMLEFNGANTLSPITFSVTAEDWTESDLAEEEDDPCCDLSMVDNAGNARLTMTTANCYLVHSTGKYKLPLVYGNAIKNGEVNSVAFNPEGTASTAYCTRFVNHADVGITGPWITKNGSDVDAGMGLTVSSAELLWQDVRGLISEVGIEEDYLTFTVGNFEPGNALIAVKNGSGDILWSWHIWATEDNLSNTTVVSTGNHSYTVAPVNLGWVPTSGNGKQGGCTHYQWGRKDPFIPTSAYDTGAHYIIYNLNSNNMYPSAILYSWNSIPSIGSTIKNPKTHYYYKSTYGPVTTSYMNMWDAQNKATGNVASATRKTIYDPCPPGFCVPTGNLFYYMCDVSGRPMSTYDVDNYGATWNLDITGDPLWFPATGYRNNQGASLISVGSGGYYWSATPKSGNYGGNLEFDLNNWTKREYAPRSSGYTIRPVTEE